jgi:hypothetical protein
MSEALLLTVIEQIDAHENKIIELNEKAEISHYSEKFDMRTTLLVNCKTR